MHVCMRAAQRHKRLLGLSDFFFLNFVIYVIRVIRVLMVNVLASLVLKQVVSYV